MGINGVNNQAHVTDGNAHFGQTAVRIGFDDAVTLVQRNIAGAAQLDPTIVGEIIAGALSLGAYLGAELAIEGIMPPEDERTSLRERFTDAAARLDAVVEHTQREIMKAVQEQETKHQ